MSQMKYVYILQLVEETEDEVSMKIDSVFTTREKAESVGKVMVSDDENTYISYYLFETFTFSVTRNSNILWNKRLCSY